MLYIRDLKNNRIPARSFCVSGLILLLILIEIFANRSYVDEALGVVSGVYLIYLLIFLMNFILQFFHLEFLLFCQLVQQ